MVDKQVRTRFIGTDEVTPVIKHVAGAVEGFTAGVAKAAAGFLLRDVVLASWDKLRGSVTGLASDLVNVNAQWETFNTQFYVQLGRSASATEQRMAELEKFAVKTPFQLAEIIEADRALQVFGIHATNAAERWGKAGSDIRTVAGDVAAGTGMAFTEISQWLGRFSVGDTGLAIRRFEQMGVTTKAELRSMGVEFSKMGELTSPVDEAMTVLLRVMERKFGGLMDIQSKSLNGMKSNLADFITVQKRQWGEPVFELYKSGMTGLMDFLNTDGVQGMLTVGQNMFTAGTAWLGDLLREWGGWFSTLATKALNWGANVVDSFASGITGSGAVSGALRNLATDISTWLKPGSPPKLLPYLDDWGTGAAEAWLKGWTGATPRIQPILAQMGRELAPFLEKIDLGGAVGAGELREKLGPKGLSYAAFVASYQRVHDAVAGVAKAKSDLADVEAEGDEDAIAGARSKLTLAEREETAARASMTAEQRKIAERVTAEDKLLEAMRAQIAAVAEKEKAEVSSAANSAQRAAEAEQRAREQAYLQYRLAVAGTTGGQIGIWEEELQKAEQGSAEYWNIMTRLVDLRNKAAKEAGESDGESYADGVAQGIQDRQRATSARNLAGASGVDKESPLGIDWGGIGSAIGGALIDGIVGAAKLLPAKMLAWSEEFLAWSGSKETQAWVAAAGENLGIEVASGIRALFGVDATVGQSLVEMLGRAAGNVAKAGLSLGGTFIKNFMIGMSNLSPEELAEYQDTSNIPLWLWRNWNRNADDLSIYNWPGLDREASGTFHAPGGWSLVGEQGPELVNLPRGSQVVPAGQTRQALAGAGGTTVHVERGAITINVANGSAREVETGVLRALRQVGVPA